MDPFVQHPQSNVERVEEQHKKFILVEIKALLTHHIAEIACLPRIDQSVLSAANHVSDRLEKLLDEVCSRPQIKNGVRERREKKRQDYFERYRFVVDEKGQCKEKDAELKNFLGARYKKWKDVLSMESTHHVTIDPNIARANALSRLEKAKSLAIQQNVSLDKVYASMPSLAAASHRNYQRAIFMNWPPATDKGTAKIADAERTVKSDSDWHTHHPSEDFAVKTDGSPTTTLEVFHALKTMICSESEPYRIEDVCPMLMWKENKEGESFPPHRIPDNFFIHARHTFELELNPRLPKPRFLSLFAENTIQSLIQEATTGKWKNDYKLLRLDGSAYRDYSEIVDRVDEDFILRSEDKPMVFGNYILCNIKEPNKDIFIDAYPSTSGMVTGIVAETRRNQSSRRVRAIAEVANALRLWPSQTHWINAASKAILGYKKEYALEDWVPDSSEQQNGEDSSSAFGSGRSDSMKSSLKEVSGDRRRSGGASVTTMKSIDEVENDDDVQMEGEDGQNGDDVHMEGEGGQ